MRSVTLIPTPELWGIFGIYYFSAVGFEQGVLKMTRWGRFVGGTDVVVRLSSLRST